jgi:hypothetical protein
MMLLRYLSTTFICIYTYNYRPAKAVDGIDIISSNIQIPLTNYTQLRLQLVLEHLPFKFLNLNTQTQVRISILPYKISTMIPLLILLPLLSQLLESEHVVARRMIVNLDQIKFQRREIQILGLYG